MRHWWWKVLCVLLLVYTAVVGLRTPLKPALVHVDPTRIEGISAEAVLTGYATRFATCLSGNRVWLERSGIVVCQTDFEVEGENTIRVNMSGLHAPAPGMWTVVVENMTDGQLRLPDAVYFSGDGMEMIPLPCALLPATDSFPAHMKPGFPNRSILNETIRNLFFHVPMWFSMIVLMGIAFVFSIMHLRSGSLDHDLAASVAVNVSLLFGALGIITGSIWARATWGGWWTSDTKLNGSALTLLMYLAYVILRGSVPDAHKRARLAAVYNIFAFMLMLVFIMVLPRLTDSLHPGSGGNPAFSQYDLDDSLRAVFYPACAGWILLGIWAYNLRLRHGRINAQLHENESH